MRPCGRTHIFFGPTITTCNLVRIPEFGSIVRILPQWCRPLQQSDKWETCRPRSEWVWAMTDGTVHEIHFQNTGDILACAS